MSEDDVMARERTRWWLSLLATTEDDELDCDAVFELLENAAEAAAAGGDIAQLIPAVALHLHHCPSCQDLFDTLVALAGPPTA